MSGIDGDKCCAGYTHFQLLHFDSQGPGLRKAFPGNGIYKPGSGSFKLPDRLSGKGFPGSRGVINSLLL